MILMTPGGKAGWSHGRAGPAGEKGQSVGTRPYFLRVKEEAQRPRATRKGAKDNTQS